ncbi:cupin domain-containing protein [Chlamydiota bacterium]
MSIQKQKEFYGIGCNLEQLIDYQEGSVISRQLLKKETGTLTLFAFDNDESLSEHTVPFDAFVYCLDGKAAITISNEVSEIEKGDCIILPAGKPHALKALRPFKMLLVMIRSKEQL